MPGTQAKNTVINAWNEWALYLALLVLPIHSKFAVYGLLLFGVTCFINGSFAVFKQNLKNQKYLLLLGVMYVLYFTYFFISNDKKAAAQELELKMSLFIAPLVFLCSKIKWMVIREKALFVYLLSCVGSLLAFIGLAFSKYMESHDADFFFYQNLSPFMHVGYYALHLTTALAIALRWTLLTPKGRKRKYFYASVAVLLGLGIVLSTSKAALICAFILFIIAASRYVYLTNKWLRASVALVVLLLLLAAAYLYLPDFKYRIDTFISSLNNKPVYPDSTNSREMVWDCAVELMGKEPIAGYGSDANQKLLDCYAQREMNYELTQKLNAHNEFFQLYLETGILGLVALLTLLLLAFYKAIRSRDFVFTAFLIAVLINCTTESLLETQAGVMYFCFFFCFFDCVNLKNKTV
ncbi:MAG: O-antigen ligase family protein [Flavobacteriales bacterium]